MRTGEELKLAAGECYERESLAHVHRTWHRWSPTRPSSHRPEKGKTILCHHLAPAPPPPPPSRFAICPVRRERTSHKSPIYHSHWPRMPPIFRPARIVHS